MDPRCQIQKTDLQSIVRDNCKHLSADQQKKLLQLLKKYELLFDGTLGDWKTKPVSFQIQERASPYHGQAFPVPKVHKKTIIKEVERLCQLGVLERQPASEWPSFVIPKKDKTIRFLSDFREVNKRLVRKPFPIPQISTVLHWCRAVALRSLKGILEFLNLVHEVEIVH